MNSFKSGITIVNVVVIIVMIAVVVFIIFTKIFSVSAQVKAIEVEQQVKIWNKLQVAYALSNEQLGSFTEIGYKPPGKIKEGGESSKSSHFNYSSDLKLGKGRFLATNNTTIEECRKYDGIWLAYGNHENIVGNAVFELPISRCAILTPNFDVIDIH